MRVSLGLSVLSDFVSVLSFAVSVAALVIRSLAPTLDRFDTIVVKFKKQACLFVVRVFFDFKGRSASNRRRWQPIAHSNGT